MHLRRLTLTLTALVGVTIPLGTLSSAGASASPWQLISTQPTSFMLGDPGAMFLLTDGKILVQDQGPINSGSPNWWLYSPNAQGNYVDGTWTQTGSTPNFYSPVYFASGVLPTGQVIIEGGEFNGTPNYAGTNLGAIYDPTSGAWSSVTPPSGGAGCWSHIADAPSVVLASGTFFVGASGSRTSTCEALFNSTTKTWTATGTGKADPNPEEGFTLLPNNKVLDVNTGTTNSVLGGSTNTEIFDPTTGSWTSAGSTPSALDDSDAEVGPASLMPSGVVFAEGATSSSALFNSATNTWSAGPQFPIVNGQQMNAKDACSAVLPNGSVLFNLSASQAPSTHWFTFDGTSITQVADDVAASASQEQSNYCNALDLPNGQVLVNLRYGSTPMEIYTPAGNANPSWAPSTTNMPTSMAAGTSYTIDGTQFGGLDEGAYFGDDYNAQSNYPLVRITNLTTHQVTYATTSGSTGLAVTPGTPGTTTFVVPPSIDNGPATAQVVVNGIASAGAKVLVSGGVNVSPVRGRGAKKTSRALTCVQGSHVRHVRGPHPQCPHGWRVRP